MGSAARAAGAAANANVIPRTATNQLKTRCFARYWEDARGASGACVSVVCKKLDTRPVMTAEPATPDIARKELVRLRGVKLTLASAAGPVEILRGVDLTMSAGEAVGIVGPSGSGKSTMMSIVAGLEKPSAGAVVVAGTDLATLDEDGLALFRRRHVGIVFQSFHLIPTMTALENVAVPLELAGKDDAFGRAEEALTAVGLAHRLGHYPAQMSGGEQQRVALARAFVGDPDLILADEPTGNLDGDTGRAIIDSLFSIRADRNTALLLITHEARLASRCDRVLRMTDGLLMADAGAVAAQ
jgi:putative ABC transport system ATP-binding protein